MQFNKLRRFEGWIPQSLIDGAAEQRRKATLIVWATAFTVLTPLPIAAIFYFMGNGDLGSAVLLGALPSAVTLGVLHLTRSTSIAGHYLTAWVFFQIAADFGYDNGFSILAVIAIPVLACAVIGERAAIAWTAICILWAVSIAINIPATDTLFFGLAWSTAVVVGVIGLAIVVLEYSSNQARRAAEEATREIYSQRERLRAFAENAFPAIAESTNSDMVYVSDGVAGVLGYSPEEFRLRQLHEYVHPMELPNILRQLEQVTVRGMHCEARMRHKQGSWVWLEVFAIPHGPGANRWIFAARSIDAEKRQREALQQSQRLESVGLIAAGVAHDFNNLLTITLGFAEILPPSQSKQEIVKATTEAAKLTQQLMSFTRVDDEGPLATDAVQLVRKLRPTVTNLFGDDVQFSTKLPDEALFVALSTGQLHQILVNLATNAQAAMGTKGHFDISLRRCEITKSVDRSRDSAEAGSYVEIVVTDSGHGMDDYTRQHAFDPFYTTKENARGAGLGLASVYGIVTNAGGHVSLVSEVGSGTHIRLLIPTADRSYRKPQVKLDIENNTSSQSSQTLLVVEEDISVRSLMVHVLEQAGFNVETATTEQAIHQLAETLEPDLLILDRTGIAGGNLVRSLSKRFPGLKVLITGGRAEPAPADGEPLDGVGYLAKPYRTSDLLVSIQLLLARTDSSPEAIKSEPEFVT